MLEFRPTAQPLITPRPLMGTGIETPARRRGVGCVTFRFRKVSQI